MTVTWQTVTVLFQCEKCKQVALQSYFPQLTNTSTGTGIVPQEQPPDVPQHCGQPMRQVGVV